MKQTLRFKARMVKQYEDGDGVITKGILYPIGPGDDERKWPNVPLWVTGHGQDDHILLAAIALATRDPEIAKSLQMGAEFDLVISSIEK